MDWMGALLMVLAVTFLVGLYISQPFFVRQNGPVKPAVKGKIENEELEKKRSALLAERDSILTALQELEFDHTLGKVPEEDYPLQRAAYLSEGAAVLKQLDELEPTSAVFNQSAEERLEAAVAARRADARLAQAAAGNGHTAAAVVVAAGRRRPPSNGQDDVETMVAERRKAHTEKAAGFCPHCGKPVQKSDKFCSRCGATI